MVCHQVMRENDMTQSTHNDLQRSIGRVEGNQSAMETRMDRFEELVKDGFKDISAKLTSIDKLTNDRFDALDTCLKEIENTEHQRKGAWKVIVPTVTILSSVITWLIGKFIG